MTPIHGKEKGLRMAHRSANRCSLSVYLAYSVVLIKSVIESLKQKSCGCGSAALCLSVSIRG